jgi:hypothetical protein
MYIKLAAADTTKGWGTALHSITVYYGGTPADLPAPDTPAVPETPDVPALPEISVENYAPLAADLSAYDAQYADRHKRELISNSMGNDYEFIHSGSAAVNATSRYCDRTNELTLKFDLTKYQDAVIALKISQNYRVLISFDIKDYVIVQD